MKTILVTGGAGYIGSHTALSLMKNGYDVIIFDNLEYGHEEVIQTLQNFSQYPGKVIDFIKGDLKNPQQIAAVFEKHQIDAVVHFAAYIRVEESVNNPQKYYKNNVGGSLNLFSAMIDHEVSKIVFSSTAAVYGEPKKSEPIIENECEKSPINPYGWSKFMVEQILRDYDKSFGIKSVILRYFNVAGADSETRIGEWHNPETHLIPNILNAVNERKTFKLFGNDFNTRDGTCVRDYVNVEDLAEAHFLALKYLEQNSSKSDCFNIGTNDGNSVKEIFDTCEEVLNCKIDLRIEERRKGDPAFLVACNNKAKEILGWNPKRSIKDSILSAYKWQQKIWEKKWR